MALLIAPLLAIVQVIAAQVGAVARSDLQTLTLRRYGRTVAIVLLISLVVVNVVTIAADLQAGAAGIGILAGVDSRWLVVPLGLTLVALLMVGKYDEVVAVLRYVLIGFLIFAVAAFLAHPNWSLVFKSSFVPTLSLHRDALKGTLALLGTTITSYVYVWETIGRGVEESSDYSSTREGRKRTRAGAIVGSIFTAAILWFMLVAAGATLGQHHDAVASAQSAAQALRPLAGAGSADLFAIGLLVSSLVALPVLMTTTAFVVGAQFDWRRGLSEPVRHARGFYGALTASLGLAFAVTLAKISIITMLVAASVIGGIGTPVGIALLILLGRDRAVMGSEPISRQLAAAGWVVVVAISGFGLLFLL